MKSRGFHSDNGKDSIKRYGMYLCMRRSCIDIQMTEWHFPYTVFQEMLKVMAMNICNHLAFLDFPYTSAGQLGL